MLGLKSMVWNIKKITNTAFKNPVLIEGLPGVGNVGKIAVDFLIEKLDAQEIFECSSYDMPHCVFVNEENMIELPMIDVYHAKVNGRSVLFLAGDIEPTSEKSCYEFCHSLLEKLTGVKNLQIFTLGGIALPSIPENPKVYCTGNSKKIMQRFATITDTQIHGVVGPIIGVSGVLPALAGKKNIPSVALLAETFGHPQYLGIKGAKEILKVLQKELKTKLDLGELQEDGSIMKSKKKDALNKVAKLKKAVALKETKMRGKETTYIG